MPLTEHVAIVSIAREVPTRDLLQVAAAVQKQVTRDFTPLWRIAATVDAFEDLASVPSDYRPVVLFGDLAELSGQLEARIGERQAEAVVGVLESDDIAGIHLAASTRQPFALASVSGAWTVTVSHETLEMLADPYGNRLVAAVHPLNRAKRVNYLLEVCDPCLATYYTVNGLPVSDFYTPRYFDPVRIESVRYSFTGAIEEPLEILPGGYLSWIDPLDSALYQLEAGDSRSSSAAKPSWPPVEHHSAPSSTAIRGPLGQASGRSAKLLPQPRAKGRASASKRPQRAPRNGLRTGFSR